MQPVGQRRALGDAHAPVPPHGRIPVAGGAHRPRDARGGDRRGHEDDKRLQGVRRAIHGPARDRGPQVAQRTVRRRRGHAHDRGADAGRQGVAERYVALSGAEFRQGVRRAVHQQGGQARIRVGHVVGRLDPPDGSAHHGPFGQQRAGAAAGARADPGGARPDLQGRGADEDDRRQARRDRRRTPRTRTERQGRRAR